MKIEFESVRYKNILSTGNEWTEVDLATHQTTLICGENGSGKSTFMDAICFGLYGKPFRRINKPQLVNSVNNKGLRVEIEFSVGDKQYKIVRGQKPHIFEVYLNETLLPQDTRTGDYQTSLEKEILKMGFKTFCQIVILGSANFVPFMQLTAAAKREFGEDMLDIQYFTVMNNLLKLRVQENKEELDQCNRQIELVDEKLKISAQMMGDAEIKKERIVLEYQTKIDHLQMDINKYYAELDSIQHKINEHDGVLKKRNALEEKRHDAVVKETRCSMTISELEDRIQFLSSHDSCPTCTQSISKEFQDKTVDECRARLQDLTVELKKTRDDKQKIDKALDGLNKMAAKASGMSSMMSAIQSQIKTNETLIKSYQHEIDKISVTEEHETYRIEELEENRSSLEITKENLVNHRELYNNAAVLLKDTGIKSQIIRQYVPVLNKLINKYLEQMDFFCLFEMNENFEETIKARHLDDFSYESFSEGEKMRVNLSMLFAWREIAKMRNSAATNLLILDEVMDGSLDAAGMDEFLGIVRELAKTNNIFIISHKTDQISDRFEKVIRFQKHKNFSRVKE